MVSATFIIPELYALFTDAKNTLSDYSWGMLHVFNGEHLLLHSAAWWISLIITLSAMGLLVVHIWFKGV
jgi:hypothetical protein